MSTLLDDNDSDSDSDNDNDSHNEPGLLPLARSPSARQAPPGRDRAFAGVRLETRSMSVSEGRTIGALARSSPTMRDRVDHGIHLILAIREDERCARPFLLKDRGATLA